MGGVYGLESMRMGSGRRSSGMGIRLWVSIRGPGGKMMSGLVDV